MNTSYKHLSIDEREKIMVLLSLGKSIGVIAKRLGRAKSTICREIKRNGCDGNYSATKANCLYQTRRRACHPKLKLNNPLVFNLVQDKLFNHQWSPEQIQHRLAHEGSQMQISYATIYRGLYKGLFDVDGKLATRKLRHKGRTRHTKNHEEKRGKIPITHHLKDRPQIANERLRIGDWEADTVLGKSGKACLVTLVDRCSRFLICATAKAKKADLISQAIIQALANQPVFTITPDRGKEFAKHKQVTDSLKANFYFPPPSQPWQRGSNENTNGLLREYFPKQQDINQWDEQYIQTKVARLNLRPRKCLNWRTPYEVYYQKVLQLV